MKVTYIGHSGFLVELENRYLLFDYYEGEIPELKPEKMLDVFASHRHGDHFNPEIFQLAEGRENIQYVLSYDIWRSRVPEHLQAKTVHLKPPVMWHSELDPSCSVQVLKSTDEGVAFLVRAEGKTIYHAGDLNDWYWEGESEGFNEKMTKHFKTFVEPLRDLSIDVGFLTLDPRQEKDYDRGFDYLLELAEFKTVFPMHCWEDYSVIERWYEEHSELAGRNQVVRMTRRGECFAV